MRSRRTAAGRRGERNGDRQPARRVDVAEQHVGHRVSALLARIPGVERSRRTRAVGQGTASALPPVSTSDDRLAGRSSASRSSRCAARHPQVACDRRSGSRHVLALLAFQARRQAQRTRRPRRRRARRARPRRCAPRRRPAREPRPARVVDVDAARRAPPRGRPSSSGHRVRRLAVIVAEQHLTSSAIGPDDRQAAHARRRAAARRRGSPAARSTARAASRASARCAGDSTTRHRRAPPTARAPAGSNMPSRKRAANRRATRAIDLGLGRPGPRAQRRAEARDTPPPQSRSVPARSASAAASLDVVAATWWPADDVADGAAVADDVAVEAPPPAQRVRRAASGWPRTARR